MKVLVVGAMVSKTPDDIGYSFVFDEVYALAKKKVEIHVARFKFEGYAYSYGIHFHDISQKIDIRAFFWGLRNLRAYIPLFRNPRELYAEFLYSKHVRDLIERIKPDVIHAHFAYPEGWVGRIAKLGKDLPFIVTLHGYDILMEPSVGYGIRLRKKYDVIVREVLRKADRIVVASRAIYEEAAKLCEPRKIVLIPNGVDTDRFNPQLDGSLIRKMYGIDENTFVVFTARHHRPVYGIEYLIRAIPYMLQRNRDVTFMIGGEGPLREYYKSLAFNLGVGKYVIFPGGIPRTEIPLYHATSNVVVVPSLQEGWGLICTEALAAGKPVIVSNVGGLRDQVIDGYNGFLVPPKDPRAIAEKILYLIENPHEAHRLGSNGRKLAVEKFNIERRAERLIKLYEEVVAESS